MSCIAAVEGGGVGCNEVGGGYDLRGDRVVGGALATVKRTAV